MQKGCFVNGNGWCRFSGTTKFDGEFIVRRYLKNPLRKLLSEGSLKVILVSLRSQEGRMRVGSGTPVIESGDGVNV